MNKIKLNETPVRTSRNFNINNIKLENVNIPEVTGKFENIEIVKGSSKVRISENCSEINLSKGLNDFFTSQVKEKANKKLQLVIDCKSNKETSINFGFDKDNLNLIEDVEIIANEGAKATVVLKYQSEEDLECYHNGIVRVNAGKDSKVNIILVNLMNSSSNNFVAIENNLQENAKVNLTIIDFGGKNSITNYYSNLVGEASDNRLNTIYLGKENQVFDLNYIAELRGKKSNIDMEVQGALKDSAKKHFKGTIDFKKGCKKATGNENEACMLLSDTARSIALPMLLCSEEDVEGNHSSSAGKIGDKELFYIMSRGFELKEAQKLMVRARFNKILESIKNEDLKELILEEIDKRLG